MTKLIKEGEQGIEHTAAPPPDSLPHGANTWQFNYELERRRSRVCRVNEPAPAIADEITVNSKQNIYEPCEVT